MTDAIINGTFKLIGKGRKIGHMVGSDPNTHTILTDQINNKGQDYLTSIDGTNKNTQQKNYNIPPSILSNIRGINGSK